MSHALDDPYGFEDAPVVEGIHNKLQLREVHHRAECSGWNLTFTTETAAIVGQNGNIFVYVPRALRPDIMLPSLIHQKLKLGDGRIF